MSSSVIPTVFVIGGTGAQGIPVIRGLVSDGKYKVIALTRNTSSSSAQTILSLGNVELLEGTFASEPSLRSGFSRADFAFVNIDGFNTGEKTEMFWAVRAYELALEEGIKFFVYGNLDYGYKKSGYRKEFRAGHYDGKGRIGEWILQQNKENDKRMKAALFTTGPYIEMTIGKTTIMSPSIEDGVVIWRAPLGDGAVVHVALEDCAHYVRWLFDNQERANGMDLEVGIDHIGYDDLAKAFEEISGHPAKYIPITMEEYWTIGPIARAAGVPAGYNSDPNDPATMNIKQNFSGFWTIWKNSGKDNPNKVIARDYKLLDEIHPKRIKSAREWFQKEQERGLRNGLGSLWERVNNPQPVLKLTMDGRKGKL